MTLETRTIALTPEQWRHVEAWAQNSISDAQRAINDALNENHTAMAVACRLDLDFSREILTSIRSATP